MLLLINNSSIPSFVTRCLLFVINDPMRLYFHPKILFVRLPQSGFKKLCNLSHPAAYPTSTTVLLIDAPRTPMIRKHRAILGTCTLQTTCYKISSLTLLTPYLVFFLLCLSSFSTSLSTLYISLFSSRILHDNRRYFFSPSNQSPYRI